MFRKTISQPDLYFRTLQPKICCLAEENLPCSRSPSAVQQIPICRAAKTPPPCSRFSGAVQQIFKCRSHPKISDTISVKLTLVMAQKAYLRNHLAKRIPPLQQRKGEIKAMTFAQKPCYAIQQREFHAIVQQQTD